MTFLKANGIRGSIGKNDWPRYTEEEPEMYEQEELDKLFKACNEEERLWYEFFLMTGMRDQEVMHTYWSDVNLAANTARVSYKPDGGWTPKAYKEREIPIPDQAGEEIEGVEGGPIAVVDCFGILQDSDIRRYFELGREVKALGRGHIHRIKEDVRSSKESSERETAVPV